MSLIHLYISKRNEIIELLTARINARREKNWGLSDTLRKQLSELYSINIIDTPTGQQPSSYEELLHTTYQQDMNILQCRISWCDGEIRRLKEYITFITNIFEKREEFAYSKCKCSKSVQIVGGINEKDIA